MTDQDLDTAESQSSLSVLSPENHLWKMSYVTYQEIPMVLYELYCLTFLIWNLTVITSL